MPYLGVYINDAPGGDRVARQWWEKGRPRKPLRQRRGEHRRALTVWVTRSVLAALLVAMTWVAGGKCVFH
ncbi:MAG: hypothetical protein DDT39_00702 [Firmicutes bacterium]|nr:hypothetical protein [candidate division NPL-UPA2 bacterium]